MEYIIQNASNKHLLILVHGLNGAASTWKGSNEKFVENLSQDKLIQENYDIALFTYGTKIFKANRLTKLINLIKGFLSNRTKEDIKGFNVGIGSISRPLESEIRGIHEKYDTISFIAHSMGGLVTKSALTWLSDEVRKKIYLFISLSVPHMGAFLANIGSDLLGNNPQIIDLKAMGGFTTQLNERYSNLNPLPKIVYQSGHQDTVVPRQSAIPPNVHGDLIENTADDHFSVYLIKDSKNNSLFNRILRELNIVIQPFEAIDVEIPEGTTFGFLITTIASRLKITVDYVGFNDNLLNTKLRQDRISSSTVHDFLAKLRDLAITNIPSYTIKQERGSLKFFLILNGQ